MTTTPALPEPGFATVEDRVQISRRLIQQARHELDRGDRLQATEKVWGALAQLLKAHGQQRGWLNLGSHRTVGRIDQRWRVRTLTGRQYLEVGDTSPVGFSNTHPVPGAE